jgi:hypothetical protein
MSYPPYLTTFLLFIYETKKLYYISAQSYVRAYGTGTRTSTIYVRYQGTFSISETETPNLF